MTEHVDTTKTITHLSLCSGYEGIGLGLRSVLPNLREVAYVEREGFPIANLVAKMEAGHLDAAPVFTDVKTFPYRKFRGCVDILSGGFPCQPFSSAGKRQATKDPRHLFPYIADGVRECQPRIVFLENVEGILSCKTADGEPVLQYVLRTLEGLGYRATAGIFSAAEVGAPHQRKRVFILGHEVEGATSGGIGNHNSEAEGKAGRLGRLLQGDREGCPVWSEPTSPKELGNAADLRLQQYSANSRETGTDQSGEGRGLYEPQGASPLSRDGSQPKGCEELANDNRRRGEIQGQAWPSRPGEPQREWEEPRVVEAQPELGRTTNGASGRVDRLRLLGNGVVPQTAAKAFVTLLEKLNLV